MKFWLHVYVLECAWKKIWTDENQIFNSDCYLITPGELREESEGRHLHFLFYILLYIIYILK